MGFKWYVIQHLALDSPPLPYPASGIRLLHDFISKVTNGVVALGRERKEDYSTQHHACAFQRKQICLYLRLSRYRHSQAPIYPVPLLAHRATPNGGMRFHRAATAGHLLIVKLLADASVNV